MRHITCAAYPIGSDEANVKRIAKRRTFDAHIISYECGLNIFKSLSVERAPRLMAESIWILEVGVNVDHGTHEGCKNPQEVSRFLHLEIESIRRVPKS